MTKEVFKHLLTDLGLKIARLVLDRQITVFSEETKREFLDDLNMIEEICRHKTSVAIHSTHPFTQVESFVQLLRFNDFELRKKNTDLPLTKLMLNLRNYRSNVKK